MNEVLDTESSQKFKAEIKICGMRCSSCSSKIERCVSKINGVFSARVNIIFNSAIILFNPTLISANCISEEIQKLGYENFLVNLEILQAGKPDNIQNNKKDEDHTQLQDQELLQNRKAADTFIKSVFQVEKMHCQECASKIESELQGEFCEEIKQIVVDFSSKKMIIYHIYGNDEKSPFRNSICMKVGKLGYICKFLYNEGVDASEIDKKEKKLSNFTDSTAILYLKSHKTFLDKDLSDLKGIPGILSVMLSKNKTNVKIIYYPHKIGARMIISNLKDKKKLKVDFDFEGKNAFGENEEEQFRKEERRLRNLFLLSLPFSLVVLSIMLIIPEDALPFLKCECIGNLSYKIVICLVLTTPVLFYCGLEFHVGAFKMIKYKPDMNLLISSATLISYFYSLTVILFTLFDNLNSINKRNNVGHDNAVEAFLKDKEIFHLKHFNKLENNETDLSFFPSFNNSLQRQSYLLRKNIDNASSKTDNSNNNMNLLLNLFDFFSFFFLESYKKSSFTFSCKIIEQDPPTFLDTCVALITVFLLGRYIECKKKKDTQETVNKLTSLKPEYANMLQNYTADTCMSKNRGDQKIDDKNVEKITKKEKLSKQCETKIPIDLIQINDILKTYPGEVVAVDGIKMNHQLSTVYESLLTGESLPVEKHRGDPIIGGCVCVEGVLILKVTAVGSATTLGRIINLVKYSSSEKKTNIQNVADSIASVFVPCIMLISLSTLLVWLIIAFKGYATIVIFGRPEASFIHPALSKILFALQFAIGVLAVACPCALGLAVPTAISVCTSVLAKAGILMKGGDSIESACKIKAIVFDKTGTLTNGNFEYHRSALFHLSMKHLLEFSNEFCEKFTEQILGVSKVHDGELQYKTSLVLGTDNEKKEGMSYIKEDDVKTKDEIIREEEDEQRRFSNLTLNVMWFYDAEESKNVLNKEMCEVKEKKILLSNEKDNRIEEKVRDRARYSDKQLRGKKFKNKKLKKKNQNIIKLDEMSYMKLFWWILGSVESTSNHPIAICITNHIKQHYEELCTCFLPIENVKNAGRRIICDMLGLKVLVGSLDASTNYTSDEKKQSYEPFNFNFSNNFYYSNPHGVDSVSLLSYNNKISSSSLRRWVRSEQLVGCTVIGVEINGFFIGAVSLRDSLKKESYEVLERLQNKYMLDVYMCTGDNRITANAFAKDLFIPLINVYAEALPSNKMNFIHSLKLKYNKDNASVCMVGDGMNDCPAIAKSDVGIALNSSQHIILDAADFIVVNNNLTDILNIIEISKRTMHTIYMNVAWCCCFNFICIPLAAGVFWSFKITLNPSLAGAMMAFSSILVIKNSLSIKKFSGVTLNSQNKVNNFSAKKNIGNIFNIIKRFVLRLVANHRVSPFNARLISDVDV